MKFAQQKTGESDSAYFHRLYQTIHQLSGDKKMRGHKKGSAKKGRNKITSGTRFTTAGKRLNKIRKAKGKKPVKLSSNSYNTLAKRQAAIAKEGGSKTSTRKGQTRITSRRAYTGGKSIFAKLGAKLKKLRPKIKLSAKSYSTVEKRRKAIKRFS
jgi:hypothetical protein